MWRQNTQDNIHRHRTWQETVRGTAPGSERAQTLCILGCNNGGGGGNFSKVKYLLSNCNFFAGECRSRHRSSLSLFPFFLFMKVLLHPDGTKSWYCPRTNTHIALLLSKMGSLMKRSKSCSKVIQKTLQSGKIDWDIHFSVWFQG